MQVQINRASVDSTNRISKRIICSKIGLLAAHRPLVIPLTLTLSNFKLEGTFFIEFHQKLGFQFYFRNDPLIGVSVESSFDSFVGAKDIIQDLVETQVKSTFQKISYLLGPIFFDNTLKEMILKENDEQQQELEREKEKEKDVENED